MTNCAVTLGGLAHILHAVHSVTEKGDSIIMQIFLLTYPRSMLNSHCKRLDSPFSLAVVLPAARSLFITPSPANPEWHGLISSDRIQRPYILGWHMDVDLIECGSDNCNYPLTSCKSVGLRNRVLSRNVQSKLQMGSTCFAMKFDTGAHCVAGHLMHVNAVQSDCVQEVQSKFGTVETQSTEVSFSACSTKHYLHKQSINIWDNLPFFTLISVRL